MRCCAQLLALASICLAPLRPAVSATLEELVPAPKLRPADIARFSSSAIKIGPADIEEIKSYLHTSRREPLARLLTDKPSLTLLATNADVLSELAVLPSFKLQEWSLHALGEGRPVATNALPKLLTIVTNTHNDEHVRALAARVVALSNPDSPAIEVLMRQIPGAPPELQLLLVELAGLGGPSARVAVGPLREHLNASAAGLQFYALRALQRIEGAGAHPPTSDFGLAVSLLQQSGTHSAEVRKIALELLQSDGTVRYLQCAALLALAGSEGDGFVTQSILKQVAHADSFVAQVAANVLQNVRVKETAIPALGDGLLSENKAVRLQAASALRRLGDSAVAVTNSIATALAGAAERGASLAEMTGLLEVVRAIGIHGRALAPELVPLLAEQSPIYQELPKGDVHHLRTWIFVTLADIGAPKEALPAIMDGLANTDESGGMLFAAAARAAATLGADGADAVHFLLRPFQNTMAEQFITFETFGAHASASGEYTTCELEALRALQQIGPGATGALPVLRAFVERPLPALANSRRFKRVPHPQKEALKTIAILEGATAQAGNRSE